MARKLDPGRTQSWDKGLLLLHMGRYRDFLALLKQIEAQEPGFSSSHVYLAVLYDETKKSEWLAETGEAYTLAGESDGWPSWRLAKRVWRRVVLRGCSKACWTWNCNFTPKINCRLTPWL